jgi:hypothetical protein
MRQEVETDMAGVLRAGRLGSFKMEKKRGNGDGSPKMSLHKSLGTRIWALQWAAQRQTLHGAARWGLVRPSALQI